MAKANTQETPPDAAGATDNPFTEEDRLRFYSWLGSRKSPKKAAASRANLEKSPREGRPMKPLSEIACSCSHGDGAEEHTPSCTVTRAIKRREAKAAKQHEKEGQA
jgi:hypothetical protein